MPKIITWGVRKWTENFMFILEQSLSVSEQKYILPISTLLNGLNIDCIDKFNFYE